MKPSKYFVGSYLKVTDLPRPLTVTIAGCFPETVGHGKDAQEKPVLRFRELDQRLVLNKANSDHLTLIFGSEEGDDWIGKRIELYNDPSVSFGEHRGGIRIRKVAENKPPNHDPERIPLNAARSQDPAPTLGAEPTPF